MTPPRFDDVERTASTMDEALDMLHSMLPGQTVSLFTTIPQEAEEIMAIVDSKLGMKVFVETTPLTENGTTTIRYDITIV